MCLLSINETYVDWSITLFLKVELEQLRAKGANFLQKNFSSIINNQNEYRYSSQMAKFKYLLESTISYSKDITTRNAT